MTAHQRSLAGDLNAKDIGRGFWNQANGQNEVIIRIEHSPTMTKIYTRPRRGITSTHKRGWGDVLWVTVRHYQ